MMASKSDRGSGKEKDHLEKSRYVRTITYHYCTKHGVRYPEGERCPSCEAEKQERN